MLPTGDQVGAASRRIAATIIAENYLAYAQVLEQSFLGANPDADFVTLVVDHRAEDGPVEGLQRVLGPDDLGLPAEELEPMLAMYSVMELSTALKPALLRRILDDGHDVAAYLDPDIMVVGDLTDVFDAAAADAIALTPHDLQPVPRDGLEVAERTIMLSGIFNLGFIAVGTAGRTFLDWWHERLTTDAIVDHAGALFTDQRWIDWVPALFPNRVLRDPGLNVAYWNVHERPLTRDADGSVRAAGAPLRFFHFSGFDADRPWTLSRFTADHPRHLITTDPVLRDLWHEYGARTAAAGHAEHRRRPYRLAEIDGVRMTPELRRVYRDALLGLVPFTDVPLHPVSEPGALRRWLVTPQQASPWVGFSPLDAAVLRACAAHVTDPFGRDAATARSWLDTAPEAAAARAATGLTDATQTTGTTGPAPVWGVIAAGAPRPRREAVDAARRVADELRANQVPAVLVEQAVPTGRTRHGDAPAALWRRTGPDSDAAAHTHPQNLVVVVDADRLTSADLLARVPDVTGVRVALWLASDPGTLAAHGPHVQAFDAVWVLDESVAHAARAVTGAPVHLVHLPVAERDAAHVPGRLVLEVDAAEPLTASRPEVAVAAVRALADQGTDTDPVRLVLAVRNGAPTPLLTERLTDLADGRDDVEIDLADDGAAARGAAVLLVPDTATPGLAVLDARARGAAVLVWGALPAATAALPGVHRASDAEDAAQALRDALAPAPPARPTHPTVAEAARTVERARPPRRPLPGVGDDRVERLEAELRALKGARAVQYALTFHRLGARLRALVRRAPRR